MALHLSETNLNDLILATIGTIEEMISQTKVDLKPKLDLSLPLLMLDASRVKQVVLNLITNAVQASPPGGCVYVRTRLGRRVVLEISDCGYGIREGDRELIFSPFFSTKRGGTGLGLAIVKKIVDAHGGSISFFSNPGKGVTFVVRFPLK